VTLSRTDTVRRLFELFNEGIDDVPAELVSPEIEFVSPLTDVRGRPYRGYEDGRRWLSDIADQFERWEYEIEEIHEEGDAVIATGVVHVQGRASGLALEQPATWVIHFADDGRIRRAEVAIDPSSPG
jgi:ketosteroid isomerase-like protein